MGISLKRHFASEKRGVEYCIETYPAVEERAKQYLGSINKIFNLNDGSKILEIGAAQGRFLIACNALGYSCEGIEPYEPAIEVSRELSKRLNTAINIREGFGEDIPYDNGTFDLVVAFAVIEHVSDAEKVFAEAFRVLKARGAFYFTSASSLCAIQDEIRFLPFFSWYPNNIKIRIMNWAVRNKPSLVGYTETPAINWFTPRKARKLLTKVGFKRIYDRWEVLDPAVFGGFRGMILRVLKLNRATRLLADVLIPACGYLATKVD